MLIKSEVNGNNQTVLNLKGRWITEPVMGRLKHISNLGQFQQGATFSLKEHVQNGPQVIIEFNNTNDTWVTEKLVEYVQDNLRPVIGSAFTEINVSPYHVPANKNENGIGLLQMIVEETGCDVDYGSWGTAVKLKPTTSTQYNEVIDLLETFEMRFN